MTNATTDMDAAANRDSPTTAQIAGTPENPDVNEEQIKRDGRENDDQSEMKDSDGVPPDLPKKKESRRNISWRKHHHHSAKSCSGAEMDGFNLSGFDQKKAPTVVKDFRIFVSTWNVAGKCPDYSFDLEDFLQVEGPADIYVIGFQEIVPLNAGNVLVHEDNEPAARWISLISHTLNKQTHTDQDQDQDLDLDPDPDPDPEPNHPAPGQGQKTSWFHRHSMKNLSRNIRKEDALLRACNCEVVSSVMLSKKRPTRHSDSLLSFSYSHSNIDDLLSLSEATPLPYNLVASKKMVGLFLTVWARRELVQHIGHLGISCVGRGIMGYLGNKGCISVSFTLHRTSFCFVCTHLASGEKEGDEVKRNFDVSEILKNCHFQPHCKNPGRQPPEKILDHDRILWLGDLNYRLSLSYEEAWALMDNNDWDSLLEKDQLNIERAAGRVFNGWSEGKITFAPTYKYLENSDTYAGEDGKDKKKRRTPAWCDRILWHGNGIEQYSYARRESRFSDHRPVLATFSVEVEMKSKCSMLRKGYSYAAGSKIDLKDRMRHRHSFGFI